MSFITVGPISWQFIPKMAKTHRCKLWSLGSNGVLKLNAIDVCRVDSVHFLGSVYVCSHYPFNFYWPMID